MMLFLIKRTDRCSYCDDTAMVVCAENAEEALRIAPSEDILFDEQLKTFISMGSISLSNREKWNSFDIEKKKSLLEYDVHSWTKTLDSLKIQYLGEADISVKKGPILVDNMGA